MALLALVTGEGLVAPCAAPAVVLQGFGSGLVFGAGEPVVDSEVVVGEFAAGSLAWFDP